MRTIKNRYGQYLTRALMVLMCVTMVSMAANAKPPKSEVRKSYIAQIKKMSNAVNYFRTYFLLDLTGDGIPELFVRTGTCQMDAQLHIYKYSTRLTKLVSIPAVHSTYYAGTGYFVSLGAHMGCWTITKFFLKNGKLMKKVLREGTLTDDDEDYPVPREYPIYEFDFDDLGPIYNM